MLCISDRSAGGASENFALPAINSGAKGSPFKGFLDISLVTKNLLKSQDENFEFTKGGHKRGGSKGDGKRKAIKATDDIDINSIKIKPKGTRFAS